MSEFLTQGEFDRFRDDLADRFDRLETKIDSGFTGINGRTRTQAEAIVALDTKVQTIVARGCARYDEHREVVQQFASGAAPMSVKQQAGIVAGVGAGLIGLIEIGKMAAAHFWK